MEQPGIDVAAGQGRNGDLALHVELSRQQSREPHRRPAGSAGIGGAGGGGGLGGDGRGGRPLSGELVAAAVRPVGLAACAAARGAAGVHLNQAERELSE